MTITIQQLVDAGIDADVLAAFMNDPADRANPGYPAGTVTTRTGRVFPVLAALVDEIPIDVSVGIAGGSAFAFAHNAADPNASLSFSTSAVVGRYYVAGAFNAVGRGAAIWKCAAAQPTGSSPAVGAVIFDAALGIVLEGQKFRFALVAEREIDPSMIGGGSDQTAAGQATIWDVVRQYSASRGAVIRPSAAAREITARELSLAGVRDVDGRAVEFIEQAGGYNGNIVLLDMTSLKLADPRQSEIRVKGINVGPNSSAGEYDFPGTQSQATGVVLTGDNGGNSPRHFHVNRLKTGVVFRGNTEKNIYDVHATYCSVAVRGDTTSGSPDTLRINLSGTNNKQAFLPDDGDTSYQLYLNTEGRIDDGTSVACYWDAGLTQRPVAYVEAKNGKHFKIGGRHRGHNGRVMITDDRAYELGADTVQFDNLGVIHCYGTVYSNYRVQHLTGHIELHDILNGRPNFAATDTTGGSIPCPAVYLRSVGDGGGFSITAQKVSNREVVRWGDATLGLWSRDAHLGHYDGVCESEFLTSGGTFDPASGRFSTAMTYLHIEKAQRCFAVFEGYGNIKAEAGSENCRIDAPHGASWVLAGYSATDEAGARLPAGRLSLDLGGQLDLDDIVWRPWAFDGLSANIKEFGGRSIRAGGSWSMPTAPVVTLAQLQSASHWVNTIVARAGAQVFYNGKPAYKSGPGATDAWVDATGATVVASGAITEQARTGAFAGRVTSAGGAALAGSLRSAYDALFYDLDEAGVMNRLILLYLFATQDAATARLNMVSGLAAGPYDAVPVSAPTFTPYVGYTGDGVAAHLTTGYNPSVQAEGMGFADMHIGLFSLGAGADAGMDAGSRDNNRLRIGATDTGMNYSTSASNIVSVTGVGSAPHHLIASRGAAPVGGRAYRNGVLLGVDGVAPNTSFMPTQIDILRQGSAFSQEKIAAFHVGKDLSDAQAAALYRALKKFFVRLGVTK